MLSTNIRHQKQISKKKKKEIDESHSSYFVIAVLDNFMFILIYF